MISIIISSINKENLERCKQSIHDTIGIEYELLVTHNPGRYSLAHVYNTSSAKAKYPYLLFLHEDVEFKFTNWGSKLVSLLEQPRVGLVGIAGTTYLPDTGKWVGPGVPFVKGRVIHQSLVTNTDQIELFSEDVGTFPVVALDGVFLATKKEVLKKISFDDKQFNGFHFYDLDFSLRVVQQYDVLVTTNILLKHYSSGNPGKEWEKYRQVFMKKHKKILPFTKQDQIPDWKNIVLWKARSVAYKKKA